MSGSVGGIARAAHRNLVEHPLFALGEPEQAGGAFGERLGQLHLAEQRPDHQNRRHAADLFTDIFPAPPLLALDVEDLLDQLLTLHA